MDYIKFLTPLVGEIEKVLKSLSLSGKSFFQQHIEGFITTVPKTAENAYVAAYNWLSYPLKSNGDLDFFIDGRPPNKYELLDLACFRLIALYDDFHKRPGRDQIYFDFLNPPDDLAHNIAFGYADEVKRLIEKEGRQGEVEAVFNQDLRMVEADLAGAKPAEKGQDASINVNILGPVKAEKIQIGHDATIQEQTITKEKKKSIIWRILKWFIGVIGAIVIGIIVTVVVDILGDFGWLQSFKAFIYSVFGSK